MAVTLAKLSEAVWLGQFQIKLENVWFRFAGKEVVPPVYSTVLPADQVILELLMTPPLPSTLNVLPESITSLFEAFPPSMA
jgi:hypothetical protein